MIKILFYFYIIISIDKAIGALSTDDHSTKTSLQIRDLSLAEAITKGIENNPDLLQQKLTLRSNEIFYEDARDTMYMPSITLGMNSSYINKIGRLPEPKGHFSTEYNNYTSQSVYLSMGQYNIYNFGKDKIVFDQAKLDWERTKELFEEAKRSIKFQIIIAYWTLKTALIKKLAYDRSLKIAESIHELQKSRLPIGKSTEEDVNSAFVDVINVKNLVDTAGSNVKSATFNLNVLLGDPSGTAYKIKDDITYLPIKVTEKILYETYLEQSPNIKTARKDYTKAQLNLELVEKNRLPLPLIKFDGVNLSYSPEYYSSSKNINPQYSNSKINLSSSISFSMPLTGPGGLFGNRVQEAANIQVSLANLTLSNTANRDMQTVLQFVQNIRQYETTIENNRQLYTSSISVLESVFKKFISDKNVSRLDIRDAITQARDSEIGLSEAILNHLTNKTQLASFIGVDYLPRMD